MRKERGEKYVTALKVKQRRKREREMDGRRE